jgi:hypothetical protein
MVCVAEQSSMCKSYKKPTLLFCLSSDPKDEGTDKRILLVRKCAEIHQNSLHFIFSQESIYVVFYDEQQCNCENSRVVQGIDGPARRGRTFLMARVTRCLATSPRSMDVTKAKHSSRLAKVLTKMSFNSGGISAGVSV